MPVTQIPATVDGDIVILAPLTEVIFTAQSNCYLFINTPYVEISKNGINWFKFVTNTPAQVKEGEHLYVRSLDSISTYNIEIIDEIYNPPSTNPTITDGNFIRITEDNKIGYGILDDNRTLKDFIGQNAVDFSFTHEGEVIDFGAISTEDGYGPRNDYSYSRGINVSSRGFGSNSEGYGTIANGHLSSSYGFFTIAKNNYSFATGLFNTGTSTETIYEIGIGVSDTERANALEVYLDGRIIAPSLTVAKINTPKSLITKEYLEENGSNGELVRVDESNGDGLVLLGRTAINYGNIGEGAIDLSYSDTESDTHGATAARSFATGLNVTASGILSTSNGIGTIAGNSYMTASGAYNLGISDETIYEVGIGTSNSVRKNGFEIHYNGSVIAPELDRDTIYTASNRVLVTKEYLGLSRVELTELHYIAEAEQSLFDIADTIFTERQCDIYVDGFRQSKNKYSVYTGETSTQVEFGSSLTELSVVDIVLFSLGTYEIEVMEE